MKTKNIFIIMLIMLLISAICPHAYVRAADDDTLGDIMDSADSFLESGKSSTAKTLDSTKMQQASKTIYSTVMIVGTIVAVMVATLLGIKFVISSADEKAEVLKTLVTFIIGCIVIFGSFTIWQMVVNIGKSLQ